MDFEVWASLIHLRVSLQLGWKGQFVSGGEQTVLAKYISPSHKKEMQSLPLNLAVGKNLQFQIFVF